MKYKLTIQEKLKDLRVEHGLSLEQLAEATGISRSALGTYENDEIREIGGENLNLRTLAEYCHVSADYLLGITDNKKSADADLSMQQCQVMSLFLRTKKAGTLSNLCFLIYLSNSIRAVSSKITILPGVISTAFSFSM